jgi:hypothetical protein
VPASFPAPWSPACSGRSPCATPVGSCTSWPCASWGSIQHQGRVRLGPAGRSAGIGTISAARSESSPTVAMAAVSEDSRGSESRSASASAVTGNFAAWQCRPRAVLRRSVEAARSEPSETKAAAAVSKGSRRPVPAAFRGASPLDRQGADRTAAGPSLESQPRGATSEGHPERRP